MKRSITYLALCSLVTLSASVGAKPLEAPFRGLNDLCYAETLKLQTQVEPPSVYPCRRALKNRTPQSRENRSANHYNLALILIASGDETSALRHLKRAVALTRKVDTRQLALGQLAQKLGDSKTAQAMYARLLSASETASTEFTDAEWSIIQRNYRASRADVARR